MYTGTDKITVLLKILLNKTTSDFSFVNLSPIFTWYTGQHYTVDMPHDFSCYGNHFGWKLCVTIVTKIGVFLNWLSGVEYT